MSMLLNFPELHRGRPPFHQSPELFTWVFFFFFSGWRTCLGKLVTGSSILVFPPPHLLGSQCQACPTTARRADNKACTVQFQACPTTWRDPLRTSWERFLSLRGPVGQVHFHKHLAWDKAVCDLQITSSSYCSWAQDTHHQGHAV